MIVVFSFVLMFYQNLWQDKKNNMHFSPKAHHCFIDDSHDSLHQYNEWECLKYWVPSECQISTFRAWNLFQHAGIPWWRFLGHAGGKDLSAVPKCFGINPCSQILLNFFKVVRFTYLFSKWIDNPSHYPKQLLINVLGLYCVSNAGYIID